MRSVDELKVRLQADGTKFPGNKVELARRWGVTPERVDLIMRGHARPDLIVRVAHHMRWCPSLREYKRAVMGEMRPVLTSDPMTKVMRQHINNDRDDEVSLETLLVLRDRRPKKLPDCNGVWLMLGSTERGMNIMLDADGVPHFIESSGATMLMEQPGVTYRLLHRFQK